MYLFIVKSQVFFCKEYIPKTLYYLLGKRINSS